MVPDSDRRGLQKVAVLTMSMWKAYRHWIAVLCGPVFLIQGLVAEEPPGERTATAIRVRETTLLGDMECFRIETPSATYLYGKRGAGFASIIDPQGNDWISYRPGQKARGEFRGLPKCGQPTKYFHCGYGFGQYPTDNPFVSRVTVEQPGYVRIESETVDKKTAGAWEFCSTHATFTLQRIDQPTFWFLYEGTPGGSLDADRDFVLRPSGAKTTLDHPWSEVTPWVCFGASESPFGLLLVNHQAPEAGQTDSYVSWPFEREANGSYQDMTVFGFGRKGYKELIKHVPDLAGMPAQFSISMINRAELETAKSAAERIVAGQQISQRGRAILLEQYALTHAGAAAKGRELFFNEAKTRCAICHKVNGQGGEVGPDLTYIGGKFGRPHLIESLLEPSRQIVEGYRTAVILMADGGVHTGIIKEQAADKLTLLDANNRRIAIETKEIENRQESPLSLMPQNVADQVTPEEFTDLVAFLETLRAGGKPTPGAGIAGPLALPKGFEAHTVATGLTACTAIEALSDGRILICEQTGTLRVVRDGMLLDQPMLKLAVDNSWERGLIGVTVDPQFPRVPWLYACYVAKAPYPHHVVSRFRVAGDVVDAGSEQILLEGDDQRLLGGKVPAGHQGGGLHFAEGGKLYIAIGDQTAGTPAQRLDTFQGKILRLNSDGTIPSDNPLLGETTGKYQAIWALGLRNPFTFAIKSGSGELFINDVGGEREEINIGRPGGNYGWPTVEHGPTTDARFLGPLHHYPHASISGGDFCPSASGWPTAWQDHYFFADFVHGTIQALDPTQPSVVKDFASGLSRPVDLRFNNTGALYVLLRNAWVIDDKFQAGTGALLEIRPLSGTKP